MKNIFDQFLHKDITNEDFETSDVLRVSFQLGNVCTYDCSYCSPTNKDGSDKWPEFSIVENIVKEIDRVYKSFPYNKKQIVFEYVGGEVTLWKDFEKLLILVYELGNKSWIVSNGVRTLRWWEEYGKYFELVTLSAHSEFSDIEHLCNVGNILADNNVLVSTIVMMYSPNWNECASAIEYLKENSKGMNVSAESLHYHNSDGTLWDYTPEQIDFLNNNSNLSPVNRKKELKWLNEVTFWRNSKTREIIKRPGNSIKSFRENNFYDWKCYVGIDTLHLGGDGDIRVGAGCRPVPNLGNWKQSSTIRWPSGPVICKYLHCNCGHDFRARKFKNNDNTI